MDCRYSFMPSAPVCLSVAGSFNGFSSNGSFAACRSDMQGFARALDRWCDCVMDDLVANHKLFIQKSLVTLECFDERFRGVDDWVQRATADCPNADVTIDRDYNLDYRRYAPFCVTKPELYPRTRWDLERCKGEVLEYAKGAKGAIESGSYRLHSKAEDAFNSATRKFNCYARGEAICF